MNIKKTLLALTLAGGCVAGAVANQANAATISTCNADFIKKTDTQVCSDQNLNFTAFATLFPNPSATRLTNRLFRIRAAGAGIVSDGYDVNQRQIATCSTGVNRDTSGTPKTDTAGCGGLAFHRTFPQL
jgi:hypothetical protein